MWKTVALRMTQAKAEIEQMGEDTDGMLESTAKYRDLIKASTGFDILKEDQKTLKSTYEIVLNIGKAWDSLNDLDRNALLYALAGTRQSNALAAALTNIEDMEKAYQAAENSAGSAQAEQEKYTKSIQYSLDVFKATKEELANNLYDSQGLKNTINMFTSLLEVINSLTKSIGGLGTAFTAFMAYKGFKGQGFTANNILNLPNTAKGMGTRIANFFTQPVLTQTAIDAGLTQDSIKALQQYTTLINNGTQATAAFRQTMVGASPATRSYAKEIARGNVQLNELSTASRAAAIGMNLLNAAMNIAVSFAISYVISQVYELAHAYENVAEKADTALAKAKERKEEVAQVQELIEKYKALKEAETDENKQETRKQTLELQKEITNLIASQPELYDAQVKKIDLVNGSLNEQLGILQAINDENSKSAVKSAANAYRKASDATKEYKYDTGQIVGGNNTVWLNTDADELSSFKADAKRTRNNTIGQRIVDELLKQKFIGRSNSYDLDTYNIEFDENTTWIQRLKFLDEAIEALEQSAEYDTRQKGLYDQLLMAREDINKVVNKQVQAATEYVQILTETTAKQNVSDIETYRDYEQKRQAIIDSITSDGTVERAIAEGALSESDIETYVNEYISTLDGLSDYYDEWVRRNTNAFENMSDAEKAWYAQQQQIFKDTKSFAFEDYKEQIEEVEKAYSTLSSLYEKLTDEEKELSVSDLGSALKEFPELAPYVSDTDELIKKVKELNKEKVTSLIGSFVELKKSISDPTQLEQLDGWINYLQKMLNLQKTVKKELANISASDYTKYEEENVQKIIDKLEKEKDAQNDILDSLKEQKEQLEEIISNYEKAADVVGKYIDRSQIQPLEDHKSEVEEYYNTQIDKLKETNDELDRNIELQKAQDALTNARKNKVHVYSETQGWHYEANTTAIQQAEKDLAELQNNYAIEDLEKQRDKEVKEIENQIKAWEDYKDQWKQQVEQITEADEELIASKILGSDWREKVANKDVDTMTNFSIEYAGYNNRLKNQVNIEISNLERAIKARENEIEDWKDYKSQLATINEEITNSNNEYLGDLNQFVIDENSTLEQRIEHLKQYAKTVKELNENNPNDINDDVDIDNALQGTGWYGIERDGTILKLYSSEAEAEQDKERIIKNLVKKQIAPGMPSNIIDTITQRIIDSLKITKYAYGGVNSHTGLSWLDGTKNNSEVVFNSAQAKQLYDLVRNGDYGQMIRDNILSKLSNNQLLSALNSKSNQQRMTQNLTISFPNATIEAKDYDSFKGFMDRYTNDLLLKMQVGL